MTRPQMLVSVHIPKTAGTAFREFLDGIYAPAIRYDYSDVYQLDDDGFPAPAQWYPRLYAQAYYGYKRLQRPWSQLQCVHGHFAASKYLQRAPDCQLITWLREPVARVLSHYQHWLANPDAGNHYSRRLQQEQLSLTEFAALPPARNQQARYLDGVPLSRFSFVGITEQFDQLLPSVGALLGHPQAELPGTVNAARSNSLRVADLSSYQRRIILQHNQLDLQLYEVACERLTTWR